MVKVRNADVYPSHVEKALENYGTYMHKVSRLVATEEDRRIVEYEAITRITAPNTAKTTIYIDKTVEYHETDFISQRWAVYNACSMNFVGLFADKEQAEKELFTQAKTGRASFIMEVWL